MLVIIIDENKNSDVLSYWTMAANDSRTLSFTYTDTLRHNTHSFTHPFTHAHTDTHSLTH